MSTNRVAAIAATAHDGNGNGNGHGNGNGNGNGHAAAKAKGKAKRDKGSGNGHSSKPKGATGGGSKLATGDKRPPAPRSEAQREASRLNGAKSRGPTTPEGKAVSCMNACTHGLFASSLRPPADFRGLDALFDQVHGGLLEQAGDASRCTDLTLAASAASKATQLAVVRRMQQRLMAPPPPPPSSSSSSSLSPTAPAWEPVPLSDEELDALREAVERLDARLSAWAVGGVAAAAAAAAAFDCAPDEARTLAKEISQLIEFARECAEDSGIVFDEPYHVSPEERTAFEREAQQREREREALWRNLAAREAAENQEHEQKFLAHVAKLQEQNEAELKGLNAEEKASTRAAFEETVEQQHAEYQRSLVDLRERQLRDRDAAGSRLEQGWPRSASSYDPQSLVDLAESEAQEAARDRRILEWGDGDRLRDEAYVAELLTGVDGGGGEAASAGPAEVVAGDRQRLVNLLREVLESKKERLARETATNWRAREREEANARKQEAAYFGALIEKLPLLERLERYERMITRGFEGTMKLLKVV